MKKVEVAISKHLPAKLAMFKPVINALVELGTNADPELVAKVIGLINSLRDELEAILAST